MCVRRVSFTIGSCSKDWTCLTWKLSYINLFNFHQTSPPVFCCKKWSTRKTRNSPLLGAYQIKMVNKKSHDWCHHPGGVSVFSPLPAKQKRKKQDQTWGIRHGFLRSVSWRWSWWSNRKDSSLAKWAPIRKLMKNAMTVGESSSSPCHVVFGSDPLKSGSMSSTWAIPDLRYVYAGFLLWHLCSSALVCFMNGAT